MQSLISNGSVLLQKHQTLVDTLFRETLCGSLTQVLTAQLKMAHSEYMDLHLDDWEERKALVKECISLWKECESIYHTLYRMAYDALEKPKDPLFIGPRPRPNPSTLKGRSKWDPEWVEMVLPPPIKKLYNAPIDPASALNIIERSNERGDISIKLYNDNETLFRYSTSSFSEIKDAQQKVDGMENFYETEAMRIGEFLGRVQIKVMGLGPSELNEEMKTAREKLFINIQCLLKEGVVKMDGLVESLLAIERERGEERRNLLAYWGNLVAKFNEVSRLRDNLLRSYHLTTTQTRSERVISLF